MDAMALLCMLHADGPATLRNLRQAGCSSLESVETMQEERLSKLLGSPAASARRFAREARHLRERLGQGLLDREESHGDAQPRALEAQLPAELVAEDPEPEEADDLPPRPVRARPEFEFGTDLAAAVRDITSSMSPADPDPVEPVQIEQLLEVGAVDGLDEDTAAILAGVGVSTLDELAAIDALALSAELGVGYTGLWRLAGLARRAVALAGMPPPKLSLAEGPPRTEPSILELEWNREIRPVPPPAVRAERENAAEREPAERETTAERENAGGPFA
jgi:hypothetical protein